MPFDGRLTILRMSHGYRPNQKTVDCSVLNNFQPDTPQHLFCTIILQLPCAFYNFCDFVSNLAAIDRVRKSCDKKSYVWCELIYDLSILEILYSPMSYQISKVNKSWYQPNQNSLMVHYSIFECSSIIDHSIYLSYTVHSFLFVG